MLDWSALWAAQAFFLAPVRRRRVLPLSFDAMGWHNAALNRSRRKAVKILVGVKKISELDAYELIWLHATQKRLTMAEIAVSLNHERAGNARRAWGSPYSNANIIQPAG
jgi:hypothetical protein